MLELQGHTKAFSRENTARHALHYSFVQHCCTILLYYSPEHRSCTTCMHHSFEAQPCSAISKLQLGNTGRHYRNVCTTVCVLRSCTIKLRCVLALQCCKTKVRWNITADTLALQQVQTSTKTNPAYRAAEVPCLLVTSRKMSAESISSRCISRCGSSVANSATSASHALRV